MKFDQTYLKIIRETPSFSYVKSDEDLAWLLNCIDGELVPAESIRKPENKSFFSEDGYYYILLPDMPKILRVNEMRAGKLCSFQCKFHRDLIDYITECETR
ncbi:MAG: hypothetical protein PHQ50_00305 [Eubacteriales bacterium]|nr:hypothetical protein [Eubacteriales bacterium]MDD3349271.1 hypothetical protein [Eubacteriales bacterium]